MANKVNEKGTRKAMKIRSIEDGRVTFDNGIVMYDVHESDCCEHHWAEFTTLQYYNVNPKTGENISIYDLEFPDTVKGLENNIQLVRGEGFNLIARDGSKYFVPCYGENNGYYSTNLTLVITDSNVNVVTFDLEDCQEIEWL